MSASAFILVMFAMSLCPGHCRFIIDPLTSIKQRSLAVDMCAECSQIIQLSANMISSRDTKETVYETLHALCLHLPKEQSSMCDAQVKKYLPKVLHQTPAHLKTNVTCTAFGLCAAHNVEEVHKLTHRVGGEGESAVSTSANTRFNPVCTLCLFIIRKLETMLPQNMTEDALKKLMGEVCYLMPKSYKDQCNDFVNKYGVQIVEFLLSSAAPHTICTLLHLCLFKDPPLPEMLPASDCESCQTLAVLSRVHLGLNSTQPQTSSFLQSVCVHHPNAIPKCEAFTRIYGPQLQQVLGNQLDPTDVCERADLCVSKKVELLGKNPCTWGPGFWCKDIHTAQKCSNVAYCERYVWKKNQ
ncbi:surfactant protein Bb isoform 2-T2 [Aulostomus maculatus]